MNEVYIQLTFIPETREEKLERQVKKLADQCEKMRKSQFAKISEFTRLYEEQREDLEILKSALCRGHLNVAELACLHN